MPNRFPSRVPTRTTESGQAFARGLGITRQSAHVLLGQLMDLDILQQSPDPDDGRRLRVHLTRSGQGLAEDARAILADLEEELATRIGADAVEALAGALARDWGPPPHPVAAHAQRDPAGRPARGARA